MTTIVDNLVKAHYVATLAQVEQLASFHYGAATNIAQVNVSYLRILVSGCQAKLGTSRRGKFSTQVQETVLQETHNAFYSAVLKGVTTPEIAEDVGLDQEEQTKRSLERNRRSNFARTAKSALDLYLRAGGDIRGLDVMSVTKQELREFADSKMPEVHATVARVERATGTLEKRIKEIAKDDPLVARKALEVALAKLEELLLTLPQIQPSKVNHGETTIVGHRRAPQRAPEMLHRGA